MLKSKTFPNYSKLAIQADKEKVLNNVVEFIQPRKTDVLLELGTEMLKTPKKSVSNLNIA